MDAGTNAPATLDPHHHADVSGGWLRPAVFGAMDGLVTNIALIAGVGGGGMAPRTIVLTGTAGLVAGAISMALGEYTSVRTQNEQVAAEVGKERVELARHPDAETDELTEAWTERGLPPELARQLADALKDNPELALRIHTQEELGVSPTEAPSPWVAAFSSFGCFAVGAVAARFTGRRWWLSGTRQLLLGAAAATATYLIGLAIGA